MSFVSAVIRSNFITLVTDGKETTDSGEILNEEHCKFNKISEKQFIAYTGKTHIAYQVLRLYPYSSNGYDLEECTKELRQIFLRDVDREKANIQVMFGGIDKGKIKLFNISNDPLIDIESIQPTGVEIRFAFMGGDGSGKSVSEIKKLFLAQEMLHGMNTPKQALKVQRNINDIIANLDNGVNKHKFDLVITK